MYIVPGQIFAQGFSVSWKMAFLVFGVLCGSKIKGYQNIQYVMEVEKNEDHVERWFCEGVCGGKVCH